tara:strand:- start:32 stop:268 length:237 start_codon:yes stop_codon:yes gene_type:complete
MKQLNKKFTPELREKLTPFYEEISELTPDLSSEEWLDLLERACNRDMTSMKMFHVLFERHVRPYMNSFDWWEDGEVEK